MRLRVQTNTNQPDITVKELEYQMTRTLENKKKYQKSQKKRGTRNMESKDQSELIGNSDTKYYNL